MRNALLFSLFVIVVAGLAVFTTPSYEAAVAPPSEWDDHLIEMDRAALDEAYRDQITRLYSTWMKDYSDTVGTPQRVAAGARNARNAYIHAMTQLERRRRSQ